MLPLADVHVHLLAERDDGPRSRDEALKMCRMLVAEGAGAAVALAHLNDHFPENTPEALRAEFVEIQKLVLAEGLPLQLVPGAEIILSSDTAKKWQAGELLSYGDHQQFLLAEMPWGLFLNPIPVARELRPLGVRLILAHAERYEEFLYDPKLVEEAIAEGCLIQVTTEALADPPSKRDAAAMKSWAQRGMIHVLGSDGHRMDRRLPQLQDGYAVLKGWIGSTAAERIGSLWGTAVLQGLPVNPPPPKPDGGNKSWFSRLLS